MNTIAGWFLGQAFALLGLWCGIGAACQAIARHRTRHHVPAAPDNQAGRNTDDLWTCRRVLNATHTARKENR